jgi:hypothetical protein
MNQVPPCKTDFIPFEIHAISRSEILSDKLLPGNIAVGF